MDNNTNNKVMFEHPLNEKIRTWLRIEFLIKQLENNKVFSSHNSLLFFHSLAELLDIIERSDIRSELYKDLEEQKQKLSLWLNVPGVDTVVLYDLLNSLNTITQQLSTNPKMGQNLKEDRFINAIRKRLAIPGGCCSFDLPLFHLWLQQPQEYRNHEINIWLDNFNTLYLAISINLQLIRQSCVFKSFTCSNNFYPSPNEATHLLRIRLPIEKGLYPQVSGNAARYAIRFVSLNSSNDNIMAANNIEFELASC